MFHVNGARKAHLREHMFDKAIKKLRALVRVLRITVQVYVPPTVGNKYRVVETCVPEDREV